MPRRVSRIGSEAWTQSSTRSEATPSIGPGACCVRAASSSRSPATLRKRLLRNTAFAAFPCWCSRTRPSSLRSPDSSTPAAFARSSTRCFRSLRPARPLNAVSWVTLAANWYCKSFLHPRRAVGINIEDLDHTTEGLVPLKGQLEKLKALRTLRDSQSVPFVINARTDALRHAKGDDQARLEEAIRRGIAYRDAGADCVYPMGLTDATSIATFVQALDFPVNVMVRPSLPSVAELERLGVQS